MSKIAAFVVLVTFVFAQPLFAQSKPGGVPDISGWKQESQVIILMSLEEGYTFRFGHETVYQNPNDSNEFVKIIAQFKPFSTLPIKQNEKAPYAEVANNYLESQVGETLNEQLTKSDPFLYIHWKTMSNNQTGTTILDKLIGVWILNQDSAWQYSSTEYSVSDVSLPYKGDGGRYIKVGIIYSAGNGQHVVMFDQNYLKAKEK